MRRADVGKFEGGLLVDGFIWSASLDGGPDEELGESESFGWYGYMAGGPDLLEHVQEIAKEEGEEPLEEDEIEYVRDSAAFILHSDSQGFVDVTAYDKAEDAEADWAALESEYEEFMGDEDEESE